MRLSFKSVPIVQQYALNRVVTTTYDVGDVRQHSMGLPWWRATFYWPYLWKLLLGWAVFALALKFAKGYAIENTALWAAAVAGLLAVGLWLVHALAVGKLAEDYARRERGVGPDFQLKVVEDKDWDAFARRLSA